MDRETAIVLLAVGLVLLPVWAVAMLTPVDHTTVELTGKGGAVDAAGGVLHLPSNVRPETAGALAWTALVGLVALLARDLRLLSPDPEAGAPEGPEAPDGAAVVVAASAPDASRRGLAHLAVAALVTVGAAILLLQEGLGLGRNQLVGLYGGILLLALAETVVAYSAHFRPRFLVAEDRREAP